MVTTEATYLRSLDVLIDHFMEDAGMNPNLPEGRRVLEKRQHHVIFSNVKEVREISARSVWVTVLSMTLFTTAIFCGFRGSSSSLENLARENLRIIID